MDHKDVLYIIECRGAGGTLDFSDPLPEDFFGFGAFTGISADEMAKRIFRKDPDAVLRGDSIREWPSSIDSRWRARRKTW